MTVYLILLTAFGISLVPAILMVALELRERTAGRDEGD